MKRFIVLAAFALCATTAFAQNNSNKKEKDGDRVSKEKVEKYEDKDREDIELSPEQKAERKAVKKAEKDQRKMAKKAEKQYRKNDKQDDGILNNSTPKNQGGWVSKTAKETTLEGRDKGKAVSEAGRSKKISKGKSNANRPNQSMKKPAKAGKKE